MTDRWIGPHELAGILMANLVVIQEHLNEGAIAVFTRDSIRVRRLPLR